MFLPLRSVFSALATAHIGWPGISSTDGALAECDTSRESMDVWWLLPACATLLVRRLCHADACLPLCRNASSSALIWSFKVEHMPWGAPGMTLSVAPFTTFADKRAESAIGTIWSSSP